jgi:hypothetical protein
MTRFSAHGWLSLGMISVALFPMGLVLPAHAAPSQPAPAKKRVGALISFQGSVKVDAKPLASTGPLFEGARVETGPDGSCTLLLSRDAVLHLGPRSDLRLTQVEVETRKAAIALEKGRMRALIKSEAAPRDFTVRSRAATLGVRGTQFVVEAPATQQGRLRVATLEGRVAVTNLQDAATAPGSLPPASAQLPVSAEVLVEAGRQLVRGGVETPADKTPAANTPLVISPTESVKLAQAYVAPPRPLTLPGEYQTAVDTGSLMPRPAAPPPPPPRAGWDAGVLERMDGKAGVTGSEGDAGSVFGAGRADGGLQGFRDLAIDPVADSPANSSAYLRASLDGEKQEMP